MREGPQPGDIGAVVRLHGLLYAREYGLDASFEAMVAQRLGELVRRGWPAAGEGLWIAESDGAPAGSITLANEGDGSARLGHFLLHPDLRGQGLGPQLLDAALGRAREAGHRKVELLTFSELTAAASIYRTQGFERVTAEQQPLWGREIQIETYALTL